jgi:hypothetical protein
VTFDVHTFCIASAGGFFLVGLLTGAWKYACIARTATTTAAAPVYVDIAHRASLMYAFACVLLGELGAASAWPVAVNATAAVILVVFFASAVVGYVAHGALRDTDNQMRIPHRFGGRVIPARVMRSFMILLIVGEVVPFGVLLAGFVAGRS